MSSTRKVLLGPDPDYKPRAWTRALLDEVQSVLDQYRAQLPISVRSIFYRLLGRVILYRCVPNGDCASEKAMSDTCEPGPVGSVCRHGHEVIPFVFSKTESNYMNLLDHVARARRAEIIPMGDIADFRTQSAVPFFHENADAYLAGIRPEIEDFFRLDRQARQDQVIEVWCEAHGMVDQLARIAHQYGVPVYSGGGSNGLPGIYALAERTAQRWEDESRPTVVLHVGDWDAHGLVITNTLRDDTSAWLESHFWAPAEALEVERIAVTEEQIAAYELPTALPKMVKGTRPLGWPDDLPTVQAEAIPPDAMDDLLRNAILRRVDVGAYNEIRRREESERARLLEWIDGAGS